MMFVKTPPASFKLCIIDFHVDYSLYNRNTRKKKNLKLTLCEAANSENVHEHPCRNNKSVVKYDDFELRQSLTFRLM